MKPVKTFFDKTGHPTNLLTVRDYKTFAKSQGLTSWRNAAKLWTRRKGGAFVVRANGDLEVYTRKENGRVGYRTFPAGKWAWDPSNILKNCN